MAIDKIGTNGLVASAIVPPDGTITTAKLANDAVTSTKIASDAVVAADIADGSITTAKLANDAVTNAKVAANAITTESISDATEVLLDATYTSGDATVTVSDTSNLVVGMNIKMSHKSRNTSGAGYIPLAGLKIASITNSTTFEMSANATGSGSSIPTQFTTGVTTDKLAENAIVPSKDNPDDQSLTPHWVDVQYVNSGTNAYSFITNQGTKIIAMNGNNGPSASARLNGTSGHGDFLIRWIPSYAWGFAGLTMIEVGGNPSLGQPGAGIYASTPAGFYRINMHNNSSNNVRNISVWNGSSSTTILNASSGTNGGIWKLWRTNGVLKVNDTQNDITLIASGDTRDWYFTNGTQSPQSCEIKEAYRLPRGGTA